MYVGQYLIIMFSALLSSFVSIMFGFYYLIKGFYLSKGSHNFKRIYRCFLTAFMYLVFIPIFVITISHSFLAPLASNFRPPAHTWGMLQYTATEFTYQKNASDLYLILITLAGIIYWISNQISNKKNKE